MKLITKKIEELHVWDDNPRIITFENFDRLKKQIIELGMYKPLLITEDGTIIGGNMRYRAVVDLGITEIACVMIEFEKQERGWRAKIGGESQKKIFKTKKQAMVEYALSDNDRAGSYDDQKLAELVMNNPGIELEAYTVDLGTQTTLLQLRDSFAGSEDDKAKEKELDENNVETEHECPKCGYVF
jgi:hypothetical protein